MNEQLPLRFLYRFRHYDAQGRLIGDETTKNLIPTDGREYMADVLFGGATRASSWYVGLVGDQNYTPAMSDTAAFLAANAGEITAYGAQRNEFLADLNGSSWGNISSPVTITATGEITVYGAFLASTQSFNSAVGTILSTVKAPSPKVLATGESLDITAVITLLT